MTLTFEPTVVTPTFICQNNAIGITLFEVLTSVMSSYLVWEAGCTNHSDNLVILDIVAPRPDRI